MPSLTREAAQKLYACFMLAPGRCRTRRTMYTGHMTDAHRFQIRLAPQQNAQLDSLSRATNLSKADLTRLAIDRLLEDRDVRLPAAESAA
jgi:hypothetical protein